MQVESNINILQCFCSVTSSIIIKGSHELKQKIISTSIKKIESLPLIFNKKKGEKKLCCVYFIHTTLCDYIYYSNGNAIFLFS